MDVPAITVLVVDGHQSFADRLGAALGGRPDMRGVGHARTGAEAIRLATDLRPDVVLLDPDLPDTDGIAVAELLRARLPGTRVVILTASNEPALVGRATAAGAAGFLAKDGSLGDVFGAVHNAHGGGMTVSTDVLARLLRSTSPLSAPPPGGLTPREHDILLLLAAGHDARAVGRRLGVGTDAGRALVDAVVAKLGAAGPAAAVAAARRRGLLPPAAPTASRGRHAE